MIGLLTMSHKEIDRLKIISQIGEKKITVAKASDLMGISQRQTYRVLKKMKEEGSKGVIHKLRGKTGNRSYPKELKEKVLKLYQKEFWDYGPTLFSEELLKYHKIALDHDTLRRWLRSESITTSMRKKGRIENIGREEAVSVSYCNSMEVTMIGLKEEGQNAA